MTTRRVVSPLAWRALVSRGGVCATSSEGYVQQAGAQHQRRETEGEGSHQTLGEGYEPADGGRIDDPVTERRETNVGRNLRRGLNSGAGRVEYTVRPGPYNPVERLEFRNPAPASLLGFLHAADQ